MSIVTIAERRAGEIACIEAAAEAVARELAVYAREFDVRFTIFGSVARGEPIATSDLDLLIEGLEDRLRPARLAAEEACERHGIVADVQLAYKASEALMVRVRRDGRTIL